METRILLDMDGVLTDFVGGALRIHGWSREALEEVWPVGEYDLIEPMGMTEDEFWEPINKMHEVFWMRLQPLPWAHELMELIRSVTNDWYIVSAPSRDLCSSLGKLHWLKQFFRDQSFDRFVPTPHKHLLATGRNVLLIDDREETVEKFAEEGGDGLVFPARHNKFHMFAGDPMSYLARYIREHHDTQRNKGEDVVLGTLAKGKFENPYRYCPHSIPVHPRCPFRSKFLLTNGMLFDKAVAGYDGIEELGQTVLEDESGTIERKILQEELPAGEVFQEGDSGVSGLKEIPLNDEGTKSSRYSEMEAEKRSVEEPYVTDLMKAKRRADQQSVEYEDGDKQ